MAKGFYGRCPHKSVKKDIAKKPSFTSHSNAGDKSNSVRSDNGKCEIKERSSSDRDDKHSEK